MAMVIAMMTSVTADNSNDAITQCKSFHKHLNYQIEKLNSGKNNRLESRDMYVKPALDAAYTILKHCDDIFDKNTIRWVIVTESKLGSLTKIGNSGYSYLSGNWPYRQKDRWRKVRQQTQAQTQAQKKLDDDIVTEGVINANKEYTKFLIKEIYVSPLDPVVVEYVLSAVTFGADLEKKQIISMVKEKEKMMGITPSAMKKSELNFGDSAASSSKPVNTTGLVTYPTDMNGPNAPDLTESSGSDGDNKLTEEQIAEYEARRNLKVKTADMKRLLQRMKQEVK